MPKVIQTTRPKVQPLPPRAFPTIFNHLPAKAWARLILIVSSIDKDNFLVLLLKAYFSVKNSWWQGPNINLRDTRQRAMFPESTGSQAVCRTIQMALIQEERASWPKSPTTLGLFLGVISFCSYISSWLRTTTEPFENGPELSKRMGRRLDGYRVMRAERRAVSPSLTQIEPVIFFFIFWSVLGLGKCGHLILCYFYPEDWMLEGNWEPTLNKWAKKKKRKSEIPHF